MKKNLTRRLLALLAAASLLLSGCDAAGHGTGTGGTESSSGALTWGTWGSYEAHKPFFDLLSERCPDIELEMISYKGANRTGYSWAQMRADDIPDIFITSQVLDEELAAERLVDLSGYDFINGISSAVLDRSEIDGGLYLLPVSYSMYGIFYNKTLMQEKGWQLPENFAELEALCGTIRAEGMTPGVIATQLTGGPFSAVFNLAKTDWLTTPEGITWQKGFLNGEATAAGAWERTMDYVQRYIDIGMFETDPEDRDHDILVSDLLGNRKAMFVTAVHAISRNTAGKDGGDELGIMPYISEDGEKNIYMYSPSSYFGISSRLAEPGNEEKLENAVRILSLLFSPEGQAAILGENGSPTVMGVLDSALLSENSMIYDAQQAMREGRAFPMTYAGWEGVLSDMGQAYKDWFRGEDGADGAACIRRMDALQQDYLANAAHFGFCESTGDFTLEQTAALVGTALGSTVGADAALVPVGVFHDGVELRAGVSGKLYKGPIDQEVSNTICPAYDGEYALMSMTGAQAKELAEAGFDAAGDGNPFEYVLAARDGELEDGETYQVAFLMNGYTEEAANAYSAEICKGSLREFLRAWLERQGTVSPDGNPWE